MKMKRVLALMLSSAMICTAVPGQVFAAEETLEVVNEFSDESDENDSVEVEDQELEESDIDEDTSNTDEEISEIDLQEGENSQQDLDIESGNNEDELFSDGENDAVFVKSGDVSDDIKWELDDSDDDGLEDTLIISGNGDMPDYTSYEEAPWYAYRKTISHLIIKDGITSIGSYSFLFKNLENIEWGDNITRIGNHTLDDCKKMTELNLPSNLVSIGSCTFGGWTALTSVEIPNNVKTMGNEAFQECENLVSVKFSNKIEEIGNAVFLNCKKVKTVFLPTSIKKIGRSFFYGRKKFDYYQSYSGCLLSTIHYAGTKEDMLKIDGINEEELRQDGPVPLKVYFHYIVYHAPKNATCSKKGFVGYWICNNCGGKIYADAECTQELSEIPSSPALGHDLDNGVVNKEASCAEEGSILYTCQREGCSYTETREIPRTQNHVYGNASYVWSSNNKECTAKRYCTICDNEDSETVETQEIITKPATCIEDGILQYNAAFTKECFEAQQKRENINPLNHQNTEIKNKKEATCNENGYTGDTYCKECGLLLSKGETIPETGHTWNTGTRTKEPTCTENGELVYACKICGKTKSEEIPALGHTEVTDEAVAATCETPGKTEGSHCSLCGVIIKEQEEIPATGHKEVTDEAVAPTCENTGKTEGSHCSVCGTIIKEQMEVPATGHNWTSGNMIKEPTCEKNGQKEYYCSVCWKTKIENIPAIGHMWDDEYTIEKGETCTEPGEKDIRCIKCGAIKEGSVKEIPATGHKEVKDAAVAATCETTGITEGSHCSLCGAIIKKQEEIPAMGHTIITIKGIKETCTKAGKTDKQYCSVCGEVLQEQQVIPAAGHKYTTWKTIKEATVLNAKRQQRICTVCGHSEEKNVGSKIKATVKLTTTSLPLKVKQKITTFKVYGMAKGDSIVSWKSSNSNIVKVSGKSNGSCVITAGNKTGKAVITITLKSKLKKNITITVTKGNITTTKITGVPSSLKLLKGQNTTLKPSILPISSKEKITYTSSNSKVVTVDVNGRVIAKNKGTAIITVKSGKKYVKCKVTVSVVNKIVNNYNKLKTYITKYGYTNKNNDKVVKETYTVPGTDINSEVYIIYEKNKDTFEFLYYQGNEDEIRIWIVPSKSPVFNVECSYIVSGYEIYKTKSYQWAAKDYDGNSLYFESVNYNKLLYTWDKATERSQKMAQIALKMANTLILKENVGIELKDLGFIKFK